MSEQAESVARGRIVLGAMGLLGGLAAWLLIHLLPERLQEAPRAYLFLSGLSWAFFAAALALTGPLRLGRALAAALALSVPLAGLLTWASLRFDTVAAYLGTGRPWAGFALLLFIALPFVIARFGEAGRWSDYAVLFRQSWMIVVRFAAAWLFVGLVWAVLFLSNALFQLVGIDLIERLIDREEVPFLLSGLTLGVALAVVAEFSDHVSPDLVLRLLRLLLPVVLAVVAVFLAALPFRGLTTLFGEVSAASTLLAMAFGTATLVSAGLDSGENPDAPGRVTRWTCRLMALLLPALAVLGLTAIWIRVRQYGLAPDRIIAAALCLLALGYGLAYALAVLRGPGWDDRIRRSNVVMAVIAMAVLAAFFTPLLDPERIAARNQLARFESGRVGAGGLDLWTLAHDWGRPGREAIERLSALTDRPDSAELAARLAALEAADSRFAFERAAESDDVSALRAELQRDLPVRPEGARLPTGFLDRLRLWELQQIARACEGRTAGGNPGCVALVADLSGLRAGDEVVIFAQNPSGSPLVRAYFASGDGSLWGMRSPDYLAGAVFSRNADAAIDALMAGDYRVAPVDLEALEVDGRSLFFGR
jgi:hypothetical protein